MKEIWKDIEGYEDMYQVSNLGKVRSLDRLVTDTKEIERFYKGQLLSSHYSKEGYECVHLNKDNKRKRFSVHRLVAKAFILNDDPINKTQVNHKDEDKKNNCVDNLEWCTREYNNSYGTRAERSHQTNLKNKSYDKNLKKAVEKHKKKIRCVTTNKVFNSIKEAAEYYKIPTRSNITACCKGKYSYSGMLPDGTKLKWEYLD